jgi:hypothetical protein
MVLDDKCASLYRRIRQMAVFSVKENGATAINV